MFNKFGALEDDYMIKSHTQAHSMNFSTPSLRAHLMAESELAYYEASKQEHDIYLGSCTRYNIETTRYLPILSM